MAFVIYIVIISLFFIGLLFFLQKTRIGMSVNVLRKASTKEDLQGLAKSLIKNWKKLLGIKLKMLYFYCSNLNVLVSQSAVNTDKVIGVM